MAGRGRDIIKKNEIRFKYRLVNAKRFAYDIIKYTTVKFGLPKDCIFMWEGSYNNYGRHDFYLVMSREIIRYHITNRCQYLKYFETHRRLDKLASFDGVSKLLQTVMYEAMARPEYDILDKVEISLSVLGELVLYLNSRDMDLYLKQLIDFWFNCHLRNNKTLFEEAGELTTLYSRNRKPKFDHYDDFHDLFISHYCVPYKNTANNAGIAAVYNRLYDSRTKKNSGSCPPKGLKDIDDLMREGEMAMLQSELKGHKMAFEIEEEKPEPDETGVKLTENTLFGTPEHQELYAVGGPSGAAVPRFQDLPDDDGVKVHVNTGLGIQEHHELYGDDGLLGAVAPPSQDLPEADPEELQYGRRLSAKERLEMRRAGFRPSLDQGLGIPEHPELYASGGPSSAVVPPSQDLPEVQPWHDRRQSSSETLEMTRDCVCSSLEETLGELSLDSSKLKTSMKKRAN